MGAGGQRQHVGHAERGRHRGHRGGRRHRLARDAGRAGQDPPPQDPRRDPGRPLEARAPGRPGGQRHRRHRPGRLQPLPVLLGPVDRADRRRRPDHGARRRQEPRPRRHRHLAGRLPRGARGTAQRRLAVRGHPPPAGPGRLRPHGGLRRRHRRLARRRRPHPGLGPRRRHGGRRRGGRALRRPPATLHLTLERTEVLRYGENPHQRGARYRIAGSASWWDDMVQHAGNPLSYLNLFDGDAAWRLVHELAADAGPGQAAVAIIKHANPCGAAVADDLVYGVRARARVRRAERLRRGGGHRRRRHRRRWPTRWPPARRPMSSLRRPSRPRHWRS